MPRGGVNSSPFLDFPPSSAGKIREKGLDPVARVIVLWEGVDFFGGSRDLGGIRLFLGPSRVSLRLGHATALTPPRGVIHYRGAASLRRSLHLLERTWLVRPTYGYGLRFEFF